MKKELVILELEKIIPDKNRLFIGADIPEEYRTDIYVENVPAPYAVALVKTKKEIINLVKFANEKDIKIITRGAGTGVAGAQVPIHGGELIIDVHLMNRILDLDEETLTLTVEPGALLSEVQQYVESRGYFYPPDPGSKHSTIGGNVSTNAGGMRAVKYGTTRDYVRSIDVVLPNGDEVTLGSLNIKNSSGYDLKNLFIGSEGTLGIITEIQLKILPLPQYKRSVLLAFKDVFEATEGVLTILRAGIKPTALEMFERETIAYSERFLKDRLPSQKGSAYVLMTVDDNHEENIHNIIAQTKELLNEQALEIIVLNEQEEKRTWRLRDNILTALMEFTEYEMLDEVVPINRFAEMIKFTKTLQEKYGIKVINFGHAGDGNVHTVLMKEDFDQKTWRTKREQLLDELYEKVKELGGLPSAEHGIGVVKKKYLARMKDPVELELMKKIKQAIDPDNRLNPGKIF